MFFIRPDPFQFSQNSLLDHGWGRKKNMVLEFLRKKLSQHHCHTPKIFTMILTPFVWLLFYAKPGRISTLMLFKSGHLSNFGSNFTILWGIAPSKQTVSSYVLIMYIRWSCSLRSAWNPIGWPLFWSQKDLILKMFEGLKKHNSNKIKGKVAPRWHLYLVLPPKMHFVLYIFAKGLQFRIEKHSPDCCTGVVP